VAGSIPLCCFNWRSTEWLDPSHCAVSATDTCSTEWPDPSDCAVSTETMQNLRFSQMSSGVTACRSLPTPHRNTLPPPLQQKSGLHGKMRAQI
jgi:hypothetical protein